MTRSESVPTHPTHTPANRDPGFVAIFTLTRRDGLSGARTCLRAPVGSTEASNGRLARFGVLGPKRAGLAILTAPSDYAGSCPRHFLASPGYRCSARRSYINAVQGGALPPVDVLPAQPYVDHGPGPAGGPHDDDPAPGPIHPVAAAPMATDLRSVVVPEGWRLVMEPGSAPDRSPLPGGFQPIFDFTPSDLAARTRPKTLVTDGVVTPT
jgi:hypothetical protein